MHACVYVALTSSVKEVLDGRALAVLKRGKYVFSTEYKGAERSNRSLSGAQFGEVLNFGKPIIGRQLTDPSASGNLVVDRTASQHDNWKRSTIFAWPVSLSARLSRLRASPPTLWLHFARVVSRRNTVASERRRVPFQID
jgi:hypothetical protein